MEKLIRILQEGGFSCVIENKAEVRTFSQRGVADLFALYKEEPAFLEGATVADKIVGKGAAALLALGGVKRLFAEIISVQALQLLEEYPVEVSFGKKVPYIINRTQTGWCPLETICREAETAEDCLPLIEEFRNRLMAK